MARLAHQITVKNYRALKDLSLEVGSINLLFGPNGSGKSTLLDAFWLLRDCAISGVDQASSKRSHGVGMRWDKAADGAMIEIAVETERVAYQTTFGLSAGRIEPFIGERLADKHNGTQHLLRFSGSDKASSGDREIHLKEPEKLALSSFSSYDDCHDAVRDMDQLLRNIRFFHARSVDLYSLRNRGSETTFNTKLDDRCQNLWSVLRNLNDRRDVDQRYDAIMGYMKKSFPSFRGLALEQTGPNSVYGNFLEQNERVIKASGVSDGHLVMLAWLTALFAEGKQPGIIAFDEPETSLHPYAISVFAEATEEAAASWGKQIFMASHSPVLISQYEPDQIFAATQDEDGANQIRRVSELPDIEDLLDQFAAGSLYMAEALAPQSSRIGAES